MDLKVNETNASEISVSNLHCVLEDNLPSIMNDLIRYRDINKEDIETEESMSRLISSINDINIKLNEPLKVMIMGEFSTGKSTLINTLCKKDITAVSSIPTTAIITLLSYSETERIEIILNDGSIQNVTPDEYKKITDEDKKDYEALRNDIEYVRYYLPDKILQTINIIDSPGICSLQEKHSRITKSFVNSADVVLWVISAEAPVTKEEINAINNLDNRFQPIVLLNKIDIIIEEDEDKLDNVISSVKKKLSSKVQQVIPISLLYAQKELETGDEYYRECSNIGELYDLIYKILPRDKMKYKVLNFAYYFMIVYFYIDTTLCKKISSIDDLNDKNVNIEDSILRDLKMRVDDTRLKIYDYIVKDKSVNYYLIKLYDFIDGVNLLRDKKLKENDNVISKTRECLQEVIKANNIIAKLMSYVSYELGVIEWDKYQQCLSDIEKMYNEGIDLTYYRIILPDILFSIAIKYGETDISKYIHYLLLAYKEGSDEAANNLGMCYQNGVGIEKNYQKAIECYRYAAIRGLPVGAYNLGYMYYSGLGVKKNQSQAIHWIKKAALEGEIKACISMGSLENDFEWLKKAFYLLEPGDDTIDEVLETIIGYVVKNNCYEKLFELADDIPDEASGLLIYLAEWLDNQKNDSDMAIKCISKFKPSTDCEKYLKLGLLGQYKRDYGMAITNFEKAINCSINDVAVLHLIRIYSNMLNEEVPNEYRNYSKLQELEPLISDSDYDSMTILALFYRDDKCDMEKDLGRAQYWCEKGIKCAPPERALDLRYLHLQIMADTPGYDRDSGMKILKELADDGYERAIKLLKEIESESKSNNSGCCLWLCLPIIVAYEIIHWLY